MRFGIVPYDQNRKRTNWSLGCAAFDTLFDERFSRTIRMGKKKSAKW